MAGSTGNTDIELVFGADVSTSTKQIEADLEKIIATINKEPRKIQVKLDINQQTAKSWATQVQGKLNAMSKSNNLKIEIPKITINSSALSDFKKQLESIAGSVKIDTGAQVDVSSSSIGNIATDAKQVTTALDTAGDAVTDYTAQLDVLSERAKKTEDAIENLWKQIRTSYNQQEANAVSAVQHEYQQWCDSVTDMYYHQDSVSSQAYQSLLKANDAVQDGVKLAQAQIDENSKFVHTLIDMEQRYKAVYDMVIKLNSASIKARSASSNVDTNPQKYLELLTRQQELVDRCNAMGETWANQGVMYISDDELRSWQLEADAIEADVKSLNEYIEAQVKAAQAVAKTVDATQESVKGTQSQIAATDQLSQTLDELWGYHQKVFDLITQVFNLGSEGRLNDQPDWDIELHKREMALDHEFDDIRDRMHLSGVNAVSADEINSWKREADAIAADAKSLLEYVEAQNKASQAAAQTATKVDDTSEFKSQMAVLNRQSSVLKSSLNSLDKSSSTDDERNKVNEIVEQYQRWIKQVEALKATKQAASEEALRNLKEEGESIRNNIVAAQDQIKEKKELAKQEEQNAKAAEKAAQQQEQAAAKAEQSAQKQAEANKKNAASVQEVQRTLSKVLLLQSDANLRQASGLSESEVDDMLDTLTNALQGVQQTAGGTSNALQGVQQTAGTTSHALQGVQQTASTTSNALQGIQQTAGGTSNALQGVQQTAGSTSNALANISKTNLQQINNKLGLVNKTIQATGTSGSKLVRVLANAYQRFGGWMLVTRSLMTLGNAFKLMIDNVRDLDAAMTELKKVTDETNMAYQTFFDEASVRAKNLGATLSDTISATADFARLGYSLNDAADLADAALVYKNVGDGISDISEASESVISTMKAFGIEAKNAMSIVDKFNETGNNFAISSSGVGEALIRSASSLATANNTLDESIALVTAANSVVQNPTKVGTALKTISMYLRAAKDEAEEAGESTEGMAASVSSLRREILDLTNQRVDIQLNEN